MMNAIIWMDRRAVKEAKELLKLTGLKEDPSMILSKIMWLKKHRLKIFVKHHKLLQASDFVGYQLTRRFATDPVTASMIHYDAEKRKYPLNVLSRLQIPPKSFERPSDEKQRNRFWGSLATHGLR